MARTEVNDLTGFVSSLGGGDGLRVEERLGNGYVRLRISEAERRQALHDIRSVEDAVIELLRNSRDAGARRIFVASSRDESRRTITIVDDGTGIPENMHKRVFDARVTTKLDTVHMDRWGVHGRGMALYSIKHNAESARVVASELGLGSSIEVVFDVDKVSERADQSTWPKVSRDGDSYEVRGPKNVARACVEFALESKDSCRVYFGSPSEIIATMRKRVETPMELLGRDTATEAKDLPLVVRPSCAKDARQLQWAAATLGIDMSERTGHRIVRHQIAPVKNVLAKVLGSSMPAKRDVSTSNQTRRLILSDSDKRELGDSLVKAIEHITNRYYVKLDEKPRIRIDSDAIHVSFGYCDSDD